MSWEPGIVKFGDGYYEFPKQSFDAKDYSRIQADYLLQHTEVTALAALFVARMARKSLRNMNVLKEAGSFFTRPADTLEREVQQELKRTGKLGFKPNMKKHESRPLRREKQEEPGPCPCPTACTPSVESFYSDFLTVSTSATTLLSDEIKGTATPTLEEAMGQLVIGALKNGLNTMYGAREREILYDEAYICLMDTIQKAVEAKWNPVLDAIKVFIDTIIDNVREIAIQRHRLKKIMTDKVLIKTNRLRNNYKGLTSAVYPPPSSRQVKETQRERKGTYNRYPKDAFGVCVSSLNESFGESVTVEPPDLPKDVYLMENLPSPNDDDNVNLGGLLHNNEKGVNYLLT